MGEKRDPGLASTGTGARASASTSRGERERTGSGRARVASWRSWPSREALTRVGVPRGRIVLDHTMIAVLSILVVTGCYTSGAFDGWYAPLPPLGFGLCAVAALRYHHTTLDHRLAASLGLLAVIALCGLGAYAAGAPTPATVIWIVISVMAMERLPLPAGLATVVVLVAGFVEADETGIIGAGLTTAAVLLAGYSLRLDAEARGAGFQLLAQERLAREAEAASVALAERARIAREIHDVLAHSLSAQMVHLEVARLQIEAGAHRSEILKLVTSARSMAREGLAETRHALSALRGDMAPVEDYLRELAREDRAEVDVTGERRDLPAEASQAVRRVAQEALTNVRKHAPGARTTIRFAYGRDEISLEIRDSGPPRAVGGARGVEELGSSGSGYGLLGMRERAELLGGSLDAGPDGPGFAVRLRVPA
ncbi:two-component sensor histidine kinase [Streptomyces litmocidini]|uniref:sensor histidine kinase n=1 Tax=Streptomyces litmocidini TaxID=67318 RepID=UPI00167F149F|nr:histidine kinase [Streptomyces litmocidini]GGV04426.1 two-component sensor histidine kinase [Streptomyces litmocidini]